MKTIEQLSAGTTAIGSSAGGGQTTGIASVMGSSWSDRVIFDAEPNRVLSKYFIEFNDLMANNDVSLIIPKISNVNLMGGRTASQEGIKRVMTKFDTAHNNTVSLTSADVKLGGCAISYETASATRVSIIEMAHKQLVRQYLNTLETDANACLEAATVSSTAAQEIFGGVATTVGTLTSSSVLSVDKLVEMKIALMNRDFAKLPGDAVCIMHPTQFKRLLLSSQFVNAAEAGSTVPNTQGRIEVYVGAKIETSTLVTAKTVADNSWGAAGHLVYMIDPSAAAGIVWKQKATIKVVSEDDERTHKVLMDAWYKMTVINAAAIVLGYFAD